MSVKPESAARRWRAMALLSIGIIVGIMMMASPAGSHVGGTVGHLWKKHIKPRTDARYYNVGENVANADRLDGLDSTAFMQSRLDFNSATFTNTAGTQGFGQVACDPGLRVVAGGVFSEGAFDAQAVNSSYPSAGDPAGTPGTTAWAAYVDNFAAGDLTFTVYAVCAPASQVTGPSREVARKR